MIQLIKEFDVQSVAVWLIDEGISMTAKWEGWWSPFCPPSSMPSVDANEGRESAKLKGVRFGRKRAIDRNVVLKLHSKEDGATEIARKLNIARSMVYKILLDEEAA